MRNDAAGPVADGRNCQRDVELATLLRHTHGLEVLDPLTEYDSPKDYLFLGQQFRRDDECY